LVTPPPELPQLAAITAPASASDNLMSLDMDASSQRRL
jgi:hypothetical protein